MCTSSKPCWPTRLSEASSWEGWPHAYHPGRLDLEGRIDAETAAGLSARGHDVRRLNDWSPMMGAMSAIVVDQEAGVLKAGADPRRDSYAVGR